MPKGIPKSGINKGWIKQGEKFSIKTRKKMSDSRTGHYTSPETRKKISLSNSGKPNQKSID